MKLRELITEKLASTHPLPALSMLLCTTLIPASYDSKLMKLYNHVGGGVEIYLEGVYLSASAFFFNNAHQQVERSLSMDKGERAKAAGAVPLLEGDKDK